ncbi:MAG: hypothetical protein V4727_13485 [Verrucomicrobiota bacterium]
MKHIFFISILLAILSSLLGAAEAPSVKKLGANESLVVEYSTHGCFHHSQSVFIFTSDKVSIYSVETESQKDKAAEVKKNYLGDVQLSDDEVKKLDALFEFYAKKPREGCTTVDHIAVSAQKDGKEIKTYEFTDGSCSTYDMKSVLTLGKLMGKVKK